MLNIEQPQLPQRFPKTLSEADVDALLAAPDIATPLGLRDRAMLELLYASGLRVSELVSVKLFEVASTKAWCASAARATRRAWCRSAKSPPAGWRNIWPDARPALARAAPATTCSSPRRWGAAPA